VSRNFNTIATGLAITGFLTSILVAVFYRLSSTATILSPLRPLRAKF